MDTTQVVLARATVAAVLLVLLGTPARAGDAPVPCVEGAVVGLCYGERTNCNIGFTGDVDLFFFNGKAGDNVRITVNGTSNCVDPRIDVRDPLNNSVASMSCTTSCSGACLFSAVFALPMTGSYTIIVDEAGNTETGSYVLDLQRILPRTPEPFLVPGVPTDVSIGHPGDNDWVRFVAEAGSEVLFVVSGISNCIDPYFQIYDDTGAVLYSNFCTTSCSGSCTFQFSVGGPNGVFDFPGQVGSPGQPGEVRTYFARLVDSGGSETGTVRVTMTCIFSPSLICPPAQPTFGPIGTNYCTATLNSTGNAATIVASGSTDLGDDEFHLLVADVPASMSGFFLVGPNQGFVPLFGGSQGNLCIGSPVGRFPLSGTCGLGDAHLRLDLPNLTQGFVIQPGSTWNFQMWFRDNNPTPTSNTTGAVSVTFQ